MHLKSMPYRLRQLGQDSVVSFWRAAPYFLSNAMEQLAGFTVYALLSPETMLMV